MNKADCICELKWIRGIYAGMRKEYGSCVEALDMAINALEQPAWIPCSERLPEKEGWYLISVKTGNVTKAFYRVAPIKQGGCYWRGHITKPTAWMELPEPWKGEAND